MTNGSGEPGLTLTKQDLREVTGYAADCAQDVLQIFEDAYPGDPRPRAAIDAARAFAGGGERGKPLRDAAFAALKAAGSVPADGPSAAAAAAAARSAMAAAGAAYLHPLPNATQVKHILGSAAYAAAAAELAAAPAPDGDPSAAVTHIERARRRATPALVEILTRYPAAPPGGGRVGELIRELDRALRLSTR